LTLGVDVGGTTVAAAVVDEEGGMLATVAHDTPSDDPRRTEDVIADVVRELMASHDVEAVGVGRPGSWTLSGPPCSSPRTWHGGMSRCARRSRAAADSRW